MLRVRRMRHGCSVTVPRCRPESCRYAGRGTFATRLSGTLDRVESWEPPLRRPSDDRLLRRQPKYAPPSPRHCQGSPPCRTRSRCRCPAGSRVLTRREPFTGASEADWKQRLSHEPERGRSRRKTDRASSASSAVVDGSPVADGAATLGAELPDPILHPTRKAGRERWVELAPIDALREAANYIGAVPRPITVRPIAERRHGFPVCFGRIHRQLDRRPPPQGLQPRPTRRGHSAGADENTSKVQLGRSSGRLFLCTLL
jgi:hypothetical protein